MTLEMRDQPSALRAYAIEVVQMNIVLDRKLLADKPRAKPARLREEFEISRALNTPYALEARAANQVRLPTGKEDGTRERVASAQGVAYRSQEQVAAGAVVRSRNKMHNAKGYSEKPDLSITTTTPIPTGYGQSPTAYGRRQVQAQVGGPIKSSVSDTAEPPVEARTPTKAT